MMRLARLSILAAAVLLAAPLRAADENPDDEIARRHFTRGRDYYDQQDYANAAREFEAARALRPKPELDYNIARSYDRMERLEDALVAYRRYLAAKPDDAEVKTRVAELQARSDAQRAAERASAQVKANEEAQLEARSAADARAHRQRRTRIALASAFGGLALASAAAGAGLVGSVAPDFDRLKGECPCLPSQYDGLQTRATAGYALFGVAGGLALVDVGLWIWAARKPRAVRR